MTLIQLGPATLARSRFALSPLAETMGTLIALERSEPSRWDGAARRRAVAEFRSWTRDDPDAGALLHLCATTKFLPDAVTIPPSQLDTSIDDELAEVHRMTDDAIRSSVAEAAGHCWSRPDLGWLRRDRLGAVVAEVLRTGWARFVEPDWPSRRAVLERDVTYRAGVLASHGWHRLLDGMTGDLRWADTNVIQFSTQRHPDRVVGDDGLVFVPQTGDRGQWTCEAPPRFALVYSARGTGVEASATADPLATLVGAGRARILRTLDTATTSSQLATLLDQSLGTVSGHLRTLRDTGLVDRTRVGRDVYYTRTERGAALVETMAGQ